jgi:DNA-binding LytR/AlgR family response regulator
LPGCHSGSQCPAADTGRCDIPGHRNAPYVRYGSCKKPQIKPQVIFITSRSDYAVEAFEYKVTDYLVKPITYARFLKAVTKPKKSLMPSYQYNCTPKTCILKLIQKLLN